jgi:SAM-dependent methyltransferase
LIYLRLILKGFPSVKQTFDELIHEQRGRMLAKLPKGAKQFLSAGCSGTWYFEWIADNYGPVDVHYGVELFSPKPGDLPPSVIWIQNSVSDMKDVPSKSIDILFSGQNVEHLYIDDMVGFFHEAFRVVKPGGHICIDSPNRLVTQEVGYTQPQHVLEFSKDDIHRLLDASGFRIVSTSGIWSSKVDGKLVSDITALSGNTKERMSSAAKEPDDAFIWWVVAERLPKAGSGVEAVVDSIAASKFPSFVRHRFRKALGTIDEIEGTEAVIRVERHDSGYVFYGPYVPLRQGRYTVSFMVKFLGPGGEMKADIVSAFGAAIHGEVEFIGDPIGVWVEKRIDIDLACYTEGVETRLVTNGANALIRFGSQIMRA